jgi:hypothetical protein
MSNDWDTGLCHADCMCTFMKAIAFWDGMEVMGWDYSVIT